MALWIQNITEPMRPDTEVHAYRLMINQKELVRFEHVRSEGAAVCLRKAADAMEKKELDNIRQLPFSDWT